MKPSTIKGAPLCDHAPVSYPMRQIFFRHVPTVSDILIDLTETIERSSLNREIDWLKFKLLILNLQILKRSLEYLAE